MSKLSGDQERRMASRELLSFISQYSQLLEVQLAGVRESMEDIVKNVMDNIDKINQMNSMQKKKADAILVKNQEEKGANEAGQKLNGDKDPFREAPLASVEQEEDEKLDKEKLEQDREKLSDNVKEAGGVLKHYMTSLDNLDSKMQDLLITMVGALSADDVVGQRLEHISSAIHTLNHGLSEVIGDFDNKFKLNIINHINKELQKKVYNSYTMEAEKSVFKKVYKETPK